MGRELRAAGPDLLPLDPPAPTHLFRARGAPAPRSPWPFPLHSGRLGGQRREVGSGCGFGEELAPDLLAGENRPQEALFLSLRPETRDGRPGEVLPDGVELLRRAGPVALLAEDRPHPLVQPLPAVLARPGQPGIPGLEEHRLPPPPERRPLDQVRGLRPGQLGKALLQPGAQVLAEPRLLRLIRETHPSPHLFDPISNYTIGKTKRSVGPEPQFLSLMTTAHAARVKWLGPIRRPRGSAVYRRPSLLQPTPNREMPMHE